jgi:predicted dehydrogenase
MTESVEQGEELIELSEKHGKILLVDHTFIYTGAVQKIKELVDQGEVGDLVYYDSTRVNLGLFQQDVDVIWDLAPHDISIMNYVMPLKNLMVYRKGLADHLHGTEQDGTHQRELGIACQDPTDPDWRHIQDDPL